MSPRHGGDHGSHLSALRGFGRAQANRGGVCAHCWQRLGVQEVRTFAPARRAAGLGDWLDSFGVEYVGMEATGVYWKPVWHVLEGHFELVLANAAACEERPGRKTDVNDAMWLADLLAHGLIRASFVPPVAVQELRTLTRTRKQFVRERTAHVQRIEKVLEDANLKLSVVLSDILGKSGRAVLQAIVDGQPILNTWPRSSSLASRPVGRAARSFARAH